MNEGYLYFLKYPFLGLLYLFVFAVLRGVIRQLPSDSDLAAPLRTPPTPAPPAEPRAFLDVVAGEVGDGSAAVPVGGEVTFGRSVVCSVLLRDAFVSGQHARIRPGPEGDVLEDLGSRNGTFLGEARIEGPVVLKDGDHFAVGDVTFRYRRAGA